MAASPAKRQRRLVVLSSDDEADIRADNNNNAGLGHPRTLTSSAALLDLPSRSKFKSTSHISPRSSRSQRAPPSSPEKRKKGRSIGHGDSSSRSLHTFFQPATEEQRWSARTVETKPERVREKMEDADDLIEDDYDSYDEIFTQHIASGKENVQGGSVSQPGRRKPASHRFPEAAAWSTKRVSSTKRFLLPTSPDSDRPYEDSQTVFEPRDTDPCPWAERYAPLNLDELAVHKRKVTDVQNWLTEVFMGRNPRRLLVLRGPAGSGKTTTIRLLSKVIGYDIIEWRNPLASEHAAHGYTSMGAQFEEFLERSDKFGSLDLGSTPEDAGANGNTPVSLSMRHITLIEEFPSVLNRTSSSLVAFRSSLQRYLAANVPSRWATSSLHRPANDLSPPVVVVVSETLLSTTTGISDNFTVHRLLGPEICNHQGTSIVEFNPIAPTFMSKALEIVLKKEARHSKRKRIPGPAVLRRLSEMGDVRSAISSLEFLCVRGDDSGDWGGRVASKLKKSDRDSVALTAMERESLEMVTQREASLGIFHAVGKVVYNKREDVVLTVEGSMRVPSPPDHLRHHSRPMISQVSVDDLMNETGTDIQTFISALHENYVPSCDGLSFTDCLEGCIESLSESDILGADARRGCQRSWAGIGSTRSAYQVNGGSVDTLLRDEISFQIAVRGVLFSLPHPVKRRMVQAESGRPGDSHKMFFPTSLRLWTQTEERSSLVNMWMRRLLDPSAVAGAVASGSAAISKSEGVELWKSRGLTHAAFDGLEAQFHPPAMTVTLMPRDDILLHLLPYMVRILGSTRERRELEDITQFHGIGARSADVPDDDLADLGGLPIEPWTTRTTSQDSSTVQKHQKQRLKQQSSSTTFVPKLPPPVEEAVEKLILSDDDIEDD